MAAPGSRTWAMAVRGIVVAGPLTHLCVGNRLQLSCPEFPQLLLVLPQVCLAADEHRGDPSAEMCDFGEPLRRGEGGVIRAGNTLELNPLRQAGRMVP